MEKKQRKYNRDEYLYKLQTNQLDYNRYTNTSSSTDTTKYQPKMLRVFGKKVHGNLQDLKLELIIDEKKSEIIINRFHGKITVETYVKIENLLQKFYCENTQYKNKLIYNGEEINNYDELMNILNKFTYRVQLNTYDEEVKFLRNDKNKVVDLYERTSLGEKTNNLEWTIGEEIHLHIDSKEQKAYVKLPLPFGFTKSIFKGKNLKIEKDLIEKIGIDGEIYLINEAGEIYGTVTLNQFLGKEEIKDEIGKHSYIVNPEKYKLGDLPTINYNDVTRNIIVRLDKDLTAKELNQVLKQIEKYGKNYSRYTCCEKNRFSRVTYFKSGLEKLISNIKKLRDEKYIEEELKNISNEPVIISNESVIEEPVNIELLNTQNGIIIEKDSETKRVEEYIYDAKNDKKIHVYTLGQDKSNLFIPGTYVNLVEYTTNVLTDLYERYGEAEYLTFITKENEELSALDTMGRAFTHCLKDGGLSVGDEYNNLVQTKEDFSYKTIEDLYDCSTKSYDNGKVKLEKGLFMNKALIKDYFKDVKVRQKLKGNKGTSTTNQMRK